MVPKHILEADPVDGIKSIMVGTGAFILKENNPPRFLGSNVIRTISRRTCPILMRFTLT